MNIAIIRNLSVMSDLSDNQFENNDSLLTELQHTILLLTRLSRLTQHAIRSNEAARVHLIV